MSELTTTPVVPPPVAHEPPPPVIVEPTGAVAAETTPPVVHIDQDEGFWDSLDPTTRKLLVFVPMGLLGLAATVWFYKRWRQKSALTESMGQNPHKTWAARLQFAMDGGGTDEEAIRAVFLEIPTKQDLAKVIRAYRVITKGKDLSARLRAELNTNEMNEILLIAENIGVEFDPLIIAKRINKGITCEVWGFLPCTDEDAIKRAFEDIPNREAYEQVKQAYKKEYDSEMETDLDWEFADIAGEDDWIGWKNDIPVHGLSQNQLDKEWQCYCQNNEPQMQLVGHFPKLNMTIYKPIFND